MQMPAATFDTWVKNTRVVSQEGRKVVVGAKSAFAKDWLENRLSPLISRTLTNLLEHPVELQFIVDSSEAVEPPPTPALGHPFASLENAEPNDGHKAHQRITLNPRYTFDQFVVGASNRLAHAASMAVAERPAEAYNPLFLYGGVGLGKTHLLQAIAHYANAHGKRYIYISSETFTNDLINAIRNQSTDLFREKYRTTDFLLVDDIQFIAGKESTQEEFFHTFNTLHSSGGQIILSSDHPPKAINTLEERLRSRFEWGLLADIQPPDLETRIAILRFKAESQRTRVPDDVMEFIARRAQNNIRELEGALNKVVAYATMFRQTITMELATNALRDIVTRRSELTVPQIIATVAKFYHLSEGDLTGRDRTKEVAAARHMAMYLAREETDSSLPQIGEALGGRDHTTVMHGWEKISSQIEHDDKRRREMLAVREMIYAKNGMFY
jgi:chromosomal replication initiator protein